MYLNAQQINKYYFINKHIYIMHYDQRSRLKALKINKIIYFILAKAYLLFTGQQYYYLMGNFRL